jgi:nucleotide-binding universal stress UspA family protein
VKRIVIGIDGSPQSRDALRVGLELAADEGAEVVLAHVVTPLGPIVTDEGVSGVPHRPTRPEDDEPLAEAARLAEEAGVPFQLELLVGLPGEELLAVADQGEADLIVVGSRGLGTVKGALLGSVSREVLAKAKTPVLVVKPAS